MKLKTPEQTPEEAWPAPPLETLEHQGYPRAVRSQADKMGDYYSVETGKDTGDEILTRQEYKDEVDINNLLLKFGVNQQMRPIKYGEEIDYTVDLQTAMIAVEQAQHGYDRSVPQELRTKYPTWQEWLNAVNSGAYHHDLQELAKTKHEAEERAKEKTETEKKAVPEQAPKAAEN